MGVNGGQRDRIFPSAIDPDVETRPGTKVGREIEPLFRVKEFLIQRCVGKAKG